jgi:hypothetical protein
VNKRGMARGRRWSLAPMWRFALWKQSFNADFWPQFEF